MSQHTPPAIWMRAREMRREPTPAEKRLWEFIRRCQLDGVKFRRQHPIGTFIVDFCCIELRFIVEIDGDMHLNQKAHDTERSAILEALGFRIVRYSNDQIFQSLPDVLHNLRRHIHTLSAAPAPET